MTHSFNRLTTIAALDIGSSKVCCLIAKISRDKKINVVGYGYNASKGIKNGIVTDINQATLSVCNAVETAEQMANERINRIIVNISGDRIKSSLKGATIAINRNRPVNDLDIKKVIEKGINKINVEDNELIHCPPTIVSTSARKSKTPATSTAKTFRSTFCSAWCLTSNLKTFLP